jgi:ECF transporter S component (folate family)
MRKDLKMLNLMVLLAMLTAVSIICGKYLAIRGGDIMRFSIENMPIIFAGMAFGPMAGALVGAVADLAGCLLVGYTINPIVTVGAAVIGIISGFLTKLFKKTKLNEGVITFITVASAHLAGSVIIKTLGLSAYYNMPFGILMLWRLLNYAIVGALDGLVVYILLQNKEIRLQINRLKEKEK